MTDPSNPPPPPEKGSLSTELLARYLASEANAEERAIVDEWAAAAPENAADLAHMREVWGGRKARHLWDVDKAWSQVQRRLDQQGAIASLGAQRRKRTWMLRIAAMLVLTAGLAYGWRTFGPGIGAPATAYATAVGERRVIELADGTRVTLGPLSSLTVDGRYNRTLRRVDLLGEAYFEVQHDSARAFQVHAFGTITEDLGTAFSVRAMSTDSTVHVVVAEGMASIRLAGAPLAEGATLRARDAASLDARTLRAQVRREVPVEALLSWRMGRIEFTDAPLGDIAVDILRWYGVTMRFETPALAGRRISYTMPTTDLDDVMSVLRNYVTVERRGDTLVVR